MKYQTFYRRGAVAAAVAIGLAGCGGGGGSDTPAVTTTTFSGTAATGAAMANATVSINCVSGSGTTTTSDSGAYSKDIDNVTLPCALRAAGTDGTMLYSVTSATATGSTSQLANITPLTHLLIASLTGAAPASFFDNFNASTAGVVTTDSLSTAQAAVLNLLAEAGISTTGVTDLIGGTLTAGSHSGYDGVLDTLLANTDLDALTASVAATSPTATAPGTTVADHTPRLPANLLLKAAASNCTALRSGDYVGISPRMGSTLDAQVSFFSFDATTLTLTNNTHSGAGGTLSAGSDACSYTLNSSSYVVSQAGILMGADVESSVLGLAILIPKQSIAVSELAGSWNALDFEKNNAGTAYGPHALTADVSSSGAFTNVNDCVGATASDSCSVSTTTINLTSNSAGGFDWVGSGSNNWTERAFAYRSGSGDLMLLTIGGGGSLTVWAKQRTLTLPDVGTAYPTSWSVRVNNQLVTASLDYGYAGAVTAVDTSAGTISRTWNNAAGTPDYSDWVTINSPRAGYNLRNTMSVTATDGRTVNLRERTSMGLPGMGVSFQTFPSISSFQMNVDQ